MLSCLTPFNYGDDAAADGCGCGDDDGCDDDDDDDDDRILVIIIISIIVKIGKRTTVTVSDLSLTVETK